MKCTKDRVVVFDIIRAVSIIGILLCHSFFEFNGYSGYGRYLGCTFNFLFLILSAFLLGASWESKGHPKYSLNYVGKRLRKISKSYYPYLVILFFFLYFFQDYIVSWKNVISHVFYLPWFDKIAGFGHLWFLTMIMICYFASWILTFVPTPPKHKLLIYCILIEGGGIIIGYIIDILGLPGYIFPYLIGYLIVFRHANQILHTLSKFPKWLNILQVLFINIFAIVEFRNDIFDSYPYLAHILGILCAISMFTFFYGILQKMPRLKLAEWISGISFEIYLVHEFFLGKFSVYHTIGNPLLEFLTLIALSAIAAIAVKNIWPLITKIPNTIFPKDNNHFLGK